MYQIVKFLFPFTEDFNKGKPRPSLVVSFAFGKHKQIILAYLTADLNDELPTDIKLDVKMPNFKKTGLRSTSLIKPHRLITTTSSRLGEVIGDLPDELIPELKQKLKKVFQLE